MSFEILLYMKTFADSLDLNSHLSVADNRTW